MAPLFLNSDGSDGPVKEFLTAWGWVFFVVNTVAIATVFVMYVDFSDANWGFYVNSWTSLAWSRITAMLGVVVLFDWLWPGHTISAILDVDKDSAPEDKRTAAIFLLGMAALSVWATNGQF